MTLRSADRRAVAPADEPPGPATTARSDWTEPHDDSARTARGDGAAPVAVDTALVSDAARRETLMGIHAIIEASPVPLLLSRLEDGCIFYANDRLEALVGAEPGSMVGMFTADFYANPADRPRIIEKVRTAGYIRDVELEIKRLDGERLWVSLSIQPMEYDGEPAISAALVDITRRKKTEEALRGSEATYRSLFDNLTELVYIQDLEGRFLNVNDAVLDAYGYTREELLGQMPAMLAAPGLVDVDAAMESFWKAVDGKPQRFEWWGLRKDGGVFPKEVSVQRSTYFGQDVVIAVARDISDRKQAEAALRKQKAFLEAQSEASIDGILVVSETGEILSFNERFIELWGLPKTVVDSGSDESAINYVLEQLSDPDAFVQRVEYLYTHPDERARDEIQLRDGRVFDRYSAPVVSCEGEYFGRIWYFRDVTEEKRHADELDRARRAAEEARMEASRYAETLEGELEFGRRIQRGLLPASLPQPEGWELAVRFNPVWQVAGDFYDTFELPGGYVGIIIADVSGKGVGAALFMALFQSLLRASAERAVHADSEGQSSTKEILLESIKATNDYVTRVHKHAHMFSSVFFGILCPGSGSIRYINAGHEPPIILNANGPDFRLSSTGPAVGIMAEAEYGVEEITLAPGDTLLAYTDGVTEARNDAGGFFSEETLLALLDQPVPSAVGILDLVERAVTEYSGTAIRSDDLTMLAVHRKGTG